MTGTRRPIAERLMRHVRKDGGGCWIWDGAKNNKGYGQIGDGTRVVLAHRVSFELRNGPIPSGMQVLHGCDNPACVNPEHLFLGTAKDNMQDMHRKGRGQSGSSHRWARLSDVDVTAIRSIVGLTQQEIADRYGVSRAAVSLIRANKRRKQMEVS